MTLDNVMEAPGGETSLGDRGGWTLPYQSEAQSKFKYDELFSCDTLLLGRITYEGFAAAWPTMQGAGEFGERMNGIQKVVVSKTLGKAPWNNSTLIKDNVVENIIKLKQEARRDILVYGSGELLQTLIANNLVDEYRLMVFPVILGIGKRLFRESQSKKMFALKETRTFDTGVVLLTYTP